MHGSAHSPFRFVDETPRTLGLRAGPCWTTCPETGMTRYLDPHDAPRRDQSLDEDRSGN